jgi:hypothetical protein
MILYCIKNGDGSRPATHWCMLFVYGQPVIQHGFEFCAFIIGEDYQVLLQIDNLSRLEEYIFLALSAITISFQEDGYG